ncbi:hypothetical protein [Streptomyces tritici]|uniref:hypothetical protein n=1 Tax=Streptomyces tritici TaxID=2054410 RepID=UPI003AF13A3B
MVTFRSPSLQVFHSAQPSGLGTTPIRMHTSSYASSTPAGMAPGFSTEAPTRRTRGRSSSKQPSPSKW